MTMIYVLVMAQWPGIPAVGCLWSHPSCSLAQEAVPGCCSEQSQLSSLAQRLSPALLCSLPGRKKRACTYYVSFINMASTQESLGIFTHDRDENTTISFYLTKAILRSLQVLCV